jgi:hypothetical protein
MCCSTGICGADIDQRLVDFAGDLDWLKSQGIDVRRINLSQEPALFAENDLVKTVLEKSGVEGLPVIIADEVLQTSGLYPARDELAKMAGLTFEEKTGSTINGTGGCCGGDNDAKKISTGCC